MHPQPPKLQQPPSAGTAEQHPFVPGLWELNIPVHTGISSSGESVWKRTDLRG